MDGNGREEEGDLEEEENGEPFVVEVVAVTELATEVRERVKGDGESERLVLPNVRGSEKRSNVKDLEVEGLKGLLGKGIVWVYVVEYGVIWEPRGGLREQIRHGRRRRR